LTFFRHFDHHDGTLANRRPERRPGRSVPRGDARMERTALPEGTSVVTPAGRGESLIRSVLGHLPQTVVYEIAAHPGGARHFTYLGGAVGSLFACTPEEATADPNRIYGTIAEEDRGRLAGEEERCLRELAPFNAEVRVRARPREERWIYASSAPRRRGGGTIVWDGIIVDITARKRAEEAAREREALLRAVVDAVADALYVEDNEGRMTLVNPAAVAALGRPAEEVLGRTARELLDPAAAEDTMKRDARAMQTRAPHTFEETFSTPAGPRVVLNTKAPLFDAKGGVVGLVGIARDITERKHEEEELRRARQKLDSLLENSPLAVIEWSSADYRIVRWSDQATKVFGWTAEEALGKRIDELPWIHPDDLPLVQKLSADMLSGARPRNVGRNRNIREDGAVIHCEWYNSTLRDPDGRFSVLSLVLDVSERERAEAALREADRARNEFLAVLSHELRNPLAPIKNSIYILEQAAPGGEQARRARAVVARQVDQLSRLVDDLLDVTRIARNKLTLQRSRVELKGLVQRTLEDYRPVFEKAEVRLELEAAPAPVHVDADAHRIGQVVGNLLHNAAKFTPAGGRVTVTVASDLPAGRAVLSVADTGPGLTPEMTAQVFEPFMQAAEGMEHREGGLGLGLALVKGIVELHGGDVAASSAGPGQGSRFLVRLPLDLSEAAPVERGASPTRERRRRVLVIEDNVDAADSLRDVLQLQGHEVAVAYDGASGIATAREFHPEIVLCDIGLRGMDGYEVAQAFRADEALRGAKLVALSGYALAADLQRAAEAGFDQHLTKPASFEKLGAVLAEP
jgi:PAS domain S-box-containing protein